MTRPHPNECYWTRDEAIAWAVSYYEDNLRWPGRRFRVETHGFNSRLLGQAAANRSMHRYGGWVVELIPTRREYLRKDVDMSSKVDKAPARKERRYPYGIKGGPEYDDRD